MDNWYQTSEIGCSNEYHPTLTTMVPLLLLAALLLSFGVTVFLVPLVRTLAISRGYVDIPDGNRKLHPHAIPNIGGIAIAGGFAVGLGILFIIKDILPIAISLPGIAVIAGALIMLVTGFVDDVRGLGFKIKFVVQLGVAFMIMQAGFRFDLSGLPLLGDDPFQLALISIPLTLIWLVGIMNAVNLLDGMDGLTTGVSMIGFASLATVFALNGNDAGLILVAVLMIGSLGGFLIYNFNPASIFMGDSGSLFLGYMLGVFALQGTSHAHPLLAVVVPALALGLPIMDTGVCFVRRLLKGHSPFEADSDHIHHRVSRIWSIQKGVVILYLVAIWLGAAAIIASLASLAVGIAVAGLTFAMALVSVYMLGYADVAFLKSNNKNGDSIPSDGVGSECYGNDHRREPLQVPESITSDQNEYTGVRELKFSGLNP